MIRNPKSIVNRLEESVGKKINLIGMRFSFKNVCLKYDNQKKKYLISENRGKYKSLFTSKDVKYIFLENNKINIRLKDG